MKKSALAAIPLSLMFLLGACGEDGGGGGRPSADEVADAIRENADDLGLSEEMLGQLPDDALDCIAEAFVESDLSDEALQAIVDGNDDFEPSSEDEEALTSAMGGFMECAGDITP